MAFESRTTLDDNEIFIDPRENTRGSKDPFYPAYEDPDPDRRSGWFCANCGSVEAVMGPMERIHCPECTNERKPTQWDACYL